MFGLGAQELMLILLIALVLFGGAKIPDLGRSLGQAIREFKRGVLLYEDGDWQVRTTGPQGSGILSSMVTGNCLIVLEEERGDVAAGERVTVEPFAEPF